MELLSYAPTLLIGLAGWVATLFVIFEVAQYTPLQRRLMALFSWALWIVPTFDIMVYRGVLSSEAAFALGGSSTLLLVVIVSLSALRWRMRH